MNMLLSAAMVLGIVTGTAGSTMADLMTAAVTEVTSTRDSEIAQPSAPSDGIASPSPNASWCTVATNGDYFDTGGTPPVFQLDLGADRQVGAISFANYPIGSNAVSAMTLRFATEAETTNGFGTSIPNKTLTISTTNADFIGRQYNIPAGESQSISLGSLIKTRYVELTLTDNHGGNRVGFDDIQFNSELPPPTVKSRRAEFVFKPEVLFPPTEGLYIGSPTAIELISGKILLACVGNPTPRMFVSDDKGKTFTQIESYPHVIATSGVGPSTLLRLADKRIAFVFSRTSAESGTNGGGLPAISFSSDEGNTWSIPAVVDLPEDEGSWYVQNDRMIQTSSGRLIIPAATIGGKGGEGDNEVSYCFFSDDAGVTWKKSTGRAEISEDPGLGMQEPCVVERKDGSLLMLARTGKGSLYKSLSHDGGQTWSDPEPTSLISACSPSTLRKMPDGRLFVFYLRARPVGNGYFRRTPFVFAISDDEGETWSWPWIVDQQPDRMFSNASVLFLKEGILSLYHRELETEAFKVGQWGVPPADFWKYGGGTRVLIRYP